ncbi:purine/pyrimidine permease [Alicyclobacillus sp.]|uniref:purine/pyrimidine permease n=1 Tax=Alicyclobacillus sp. TaxID=61169 RepID=UPI0025B9C511|nr:purine/pyrimidine permease [Alicyclobacillus sp.]MCL6515457.1 purine/pyrimidine permease [Alicyclobacillus sp.]
MEGRFFALAERPGAAVTALAAVQWLMFMLASVVTVPVVLGAQLGLSPAEASAFVDRTFFVSGVITLLQVTVGHRLPIIEGPAGMWWGVWVVLIQITREQGASIDGLLRDLELALCLAALVYLVLAGFGWMARVQRWFTPAVTGTFMTLLALQLAQSLLGGMLGVSATGRVQPLQAAISVGLVGLSVWLTVRGRGLWRSLSVLVTLGVGWALYGLLGWTNPGPRTEAWVALPAWFPFGTPSWHSGIVLTGMLTMVILLSNVVSSVQVMVQAARQPVDERGLRRGTLVSGAGTLMAGMFGTVGMVPLSTSASLVALTGVASRLPFLIAAFALTLLGLVPAVGHALSTLPESVGYAALFTVFGQLLGFGLKDFQALALDQRDLFVVTLSVMAGVGVFFIPSQAWAGLPPVLAYLLDNGLIVGVGLVLLLEHVVLKRRQAPVHSVERGT